MSNITNDWMNQSVTVHMPRQNILKIMLMFLEWAQKNEGQTFSCLR